MAKLEKKKLYLFVKNNDHLNGYKTWFNLALIVYTSMLDDVHMVRAF